MRVDGGRIVAARGACDLGLSWFGDGVVPVAIRVDGRDAPLDEALTAAARILTSARRPLVYLAGDLSCEAQRQAIALADIQRATLGSLSSSSVMPSILAAQELGRAAATLGEIRNRADVVVFWGVDPSARYPRYWTRYAPEPEGVHLPEGRRSRTVLAVDVGDARGPADADRRLQIDAAREVAVLTMLTALAAKPPAAGTDDADADDESAAAGLEGIARVMQRGRYVAIVADAEPVPAGPGTATDVRTRRARLDTGRSSALIALAHALNATTRCALSLLRAGGNRSGADASLTAQTGYPAAVDFSAGYPRYRPHELAGREAAAADAVVVVGRADAIPPSVLSGFAPAQRVVIGPYASTGPLADGRVVVDTGVAGIHEGGTAVRMDDVPLPLRPVLTGPPSAAAVIHELRGRVSLRVG